MLQEYIRNPDTGLLVRADGKKGREILKTTGRHENVEITDKKTKKSPPTIREYQQQCATLSKPQSSTKRKALYLMDLNEQKNKVLKQLHRNNKKKASKSSHKK